MGNIIIGVLCLAYGICTLILRKKKPESFSKLEAMKRAYGERTGYAIHFIAYSIMPILVGIAFIVFYTIWGISML